MAQQYLIRRDTSAWILQVWAAFAAAVALCVVGVWNAPGEGIDRAFLAIAFLFGLSSAFGVAKTVRDNRDEQVDTPAWVLQVWAAFAIAVIVTIWGLFRLELGSWEKGYMVASWLFLISATFTLAKTVRDNHEAGVLEGAETVASLAESQKDAR
jgi:hypothetical protein